MTGDGNKKKEGTLIPVMTDKPPAPETLLRVIRCYCKVDCNTARCSCRIESTDLTVHLPVESVVEVLVSIHVLTDPDSDTEDVGSNALLLNFSTVKVIPFNCIAHPFCAVFFRD